MSIYRPRKTLPDTDVRTIASPEGADAHIPPAAEETTSGWAAMRKSKPLNVVLPLGRKWSDELPLHLRPINLIEQYPRIVNLLAMDWNNRTAITRLFDDLVQDQRGDREGFPHEVRKELRALRDYYYVAVLR